MKYRTRIYYTETDKALMWERWRQGESLQAIAELFDRNHSAGVEPDTHDCLCPYFCPDPLRHSVCGGAVIWDGNAHSNGRYRTRRLLP